MTTTLGTKMYEVAAVRVLKNDSRYMPSTQLRSQHLVSSAILVSRGCRYLERLLWVQLTTPTSVSLDTKGSLSVIIYDAQPSHNKVYNLRNAS